MKWGQAGLLGALTPFGCTCLSCLIMGGEIFRVLCFVRCVLSFLFSTFIVYIRLGLF